MKITDYKQHILFVTNDESYWYRFPQDFHLFYERAKYAFGFVRLLDYGGIIATSPVDHIDWDKESVMIKYIAGVFAGIREL